MQLVAAILFFYVFGMAAVIMTWYTARIVMQYVQEGQEQKRKRPVSSIEDEPIKLHISDGRIVVNRLPEDP